MRVIYYSKTFFTDCDFPLIRELQCKGVDIWYFFSINENNKRHALLDIKNIKPKKGIYKASEYPELSIYKDYIDLNKVFLINIPLGGCEWKTKLFWVYVFFRMLSLNAKVFHFTWQLSGYEAYLYRLPLRKVMTVHDPLSHSSVINPWEEKERVRAFLESDSFILLSDVLKDQFCQKYNISNDRILIARMGEFNHLQYLKSSNLELPKRFVLFFGQILSYKGLEYLCEAMVLIHQRHPDTSLVIAGSGQLYFDFSKYEDLPYIKLRNEYIAISDLAEMLQKALFAVCPYKDATQSGVVQTAFSANCPLIVTNVGALPVSVRDGFYGRVIPSCDTESLVNAMDDLLTNSEKLVLYRKNIEEQWRASMQWKPIGAVYCDAWEIK